MYEENRPFGVVADNMITEVGSYINDLTKRGFSYIESQCVPNGAMTGLSWGENLPDTPENTFDSLMKERKLPEALAWKAVLFEAERMTHQSQELDVGPNGEKIKSRLGSIMEMIKDQVSEMVEETDFGFLEHMNIEEIKNELSNAYASKDISAIIFYICAYSLHLQMKRISGAD